MNAKLITATAAHVTITRSSSMTDYAINDENTGKKVAHVSIERGFAHITGTMGSAFYGLNAVVRLDGPNLSAVVTALAEGLRNGRDDRN